MNLSLTNDIMIDQQDQQKRDVIWYEKVRINFKNGAYTGHGLDTTLRGQYGRAVTLGQLKLQAM